ncbi:MAG: hypothetical protein E7013_05595 [Alphaproteobacteria bacterium]|nr:hypothetical protein [Alphaproteobacteria bacterium]
MYDEVIKKFKSDLEEKINITKFHYEPLEISKEKFFEIMLEEVKDKVRIKEIFNGLTILTQNSEYGTFYTIVFEGKSFSIEDVDLITELLAYTKRNSKDDRRIGKNIYFINCEFRTPFSIKDLCHRAIFSNCIFLRDFSITGSIPISLEFTYCKFEALLNLEGIKTGHRVDIQNCFFEKNSILILKNSLFYMGGFIHLTNNQFFGSFDAENANMGTSVVFKNISFFNEFNFDKVTFRGLCKFKNIAFSNPRSKESIKMQSIFAKALKNSGFEKEIENLGLQLKSIKDIKIDLDAYNIALQSGLLKTEYAAYFLGKSVNYLAKKRAKDKEQITREALPFIGKGKDIQYPVDALNAFKAKDWVKLKELRKKYEMNEEEKED